MSIFQNLRAQYQAITRNKRLPRNRGTSSVKLTIEPLEQRTLLTTTVFLDFGFAFPSNPSDPDQDGLFVTDDLIDAVADGPDGFPDEGKRLISLERSVRNQNIDLTGDGVGDWFDARILAAQILSSVRRTFEPFDIIVREAAASGFQDIASSLSDATGNDAYIIVAGSNTNVEGTPWGRADVDFDGVLPGNNEDNIGVAFADTLLSAGIRALGIGRVAAHEAGHTFGLVHTLGAASDLMSVTNRNFFVQPFVGNYDLPVDEEFANIWEQQNAFAHLATSDVVGYRDDGRVFVMGTPGSDAISLTPIGASRARVQIQRLGVATPSGQAPTIALYEIDTSHGVTVEAGLSDDIITVRSALQGAIEVRGGAGTDVLQVVDWEETGGVTYEISNFHISSTAGLDVGFLPNEISEIRIHASDHPDTFNVNSLLAGISLTISADRPGGDPSVGANRIRLAPASVGRNLSAIQGDVRYADGSDYDTVELFDQSDSASRDYEIYAEPARQKSASISRDGSGQYRFEKIARVTLHSGSGDSNFNVHRTDPSVAWEILAGAGDDNLRLSPDDHRAGRLPLTSNPQFRFHGEEGVDQVEIFDEASLQAATYTYTDLDGVILPAIHRAAADANGWLVAYEGVSHVVHWGDLASDTFNINHVPLGTNLEIHGDPGAFEIADTFNVGGGNYAANIHGAVTVIGGGGDDVLVIKDANDVAGMRDLGNAAPFGTNPIVGNRDVYTFEPTTFVKREEDQGPMGTFFFDTPMLSFSSMATVRLDASGTNGEQIPDTRIRVNGTSAGTRLILNGNAGVEEFHIDAAGLRSDVVVSGGAPSTAPGDSLHVTGTPSMTANYTPDLTFPTAGVVRTRGRNITFSGLEPVSLENFSWVTMISPRSHDIIHVAPEAGGWTKISGTSGHPSLPLPFESLSFRDVRNVILDTAARDLVSFEYPPASGVIWPPFPDDTVTVLPGALDARGLESFSVVTGTSFAGNTVNDYTLQGGSTTPAELNVDGLGGRTHVNVFGAAARGDLEQMPGFQSRFIAYDSAGQPVYQSGFNFIELLVLPDSWDYVRAIGENVDRTFSGSTTQLIQGPDLTTVSVSPGLENSRLDIVALKNSRVDLLESPYRERTISGLRSAGPQPEPPKSPDNITIAYRDVFAAGPQPEPPRARIVGYDPEDRVNLESIKDSQNLPLPTDFHLAFDETNPRQIELLVHTAGLLTPLGFEVETDAMGAGPAIGLIGDPSVQNQVAAVRPAAIEPATIEPLPPILLTGINTLDIVGTADDEGLFVTPNDSGGLQIDSVSMGNMGRSLRFVGDEHLIGLQSDGGGGLDTFDIEYPEPDFHNLTTRLQGTESIHLNPFSIEPATLRPVRQTLTPTAGEIRTGNLLLTHDEALSTSRVKATSVELLVTPDPQSHLFNRDVSLSYAYLGSEGKYVIKDVTFAGRFDLTVEHKDGTTNTTTIQEDEVVYKRQTTKKIVGANSGQDQILVSKTAVETKAGSVLDVDLNTGEDILVIAQTDSGSAEGAEDKIAIKGSGDPQSTEDSKAILVHKQQAATTEQQLDDLATEKPEYAVKIEALKTAADQDLLRKQAAPTTDGGELTVEYEGENSKVDVFLKNVDITKKIAASVTNPDGSTQIVAVGNVVLSVPELDGTGIDPTQPFTTFTVVNTLDSGKGSLRWALEAANAWTGLAVVTYAIPRTDPNFVDIDAHLPGGDPEPDVFVISPATPLPPLTRGNIIINGQSQQNAPDLPHGESAALRFTGRITSVDAALAGSFAVDGPVNVTVDFDAAFPDTAPDDPTFGRYFTVPPDPADFGAISQMTAVVDGYSVQSADGVIDVYDDFTNQAGFTFDRYMAGATADHGLVGAAVGDYTLQATDMVLIDATLTAFSSDALPTSLDVAAFANRQFKLLFRNPSGAFAWVRGEITGIESASSSTPLVTDTNQGDTNPFGPEIVLSGSAITGAADGLRLDSNGNRVHGLVIQEFAGNGILVTGDENRITGSYLGTGADGREPFGNERGVTIENGEENWIGGKTPGERNIVSFNAYENILINRTSGTTVQGNYIGTDATGTELGRYSRHGIRVIDDRGSLIGGSNTGEGNVISGNYYGIYIHGRWVEGGTQGLAIQGNRIGTSADGQQALPNFQGIYVDGFEDETVRYEAHDVIIGGLEPGAGNIVSSNQNGGIIVRGPNLTGIVIQGNKVGTDIDGIDALPNGPGVLVQDATGVVIGGIEDAAQNIISGNNGSGISIVGGAGNIVQGNLIGVGADGVTDLGNFDGVLLTSTTDTRIGGTAEGAQNVISGNRRYGIGVSTSTFTTIQSNLIGTDVSGTVAVGNALAGVELTGYATDTLIGGSEAGSGNLISGNPYGVRVSGAGATERTRIEGNRIGTSADGNTALGNGTGIQVLATGGSIVRQTAIGGADSGAGNVISGNTNHGIHVVGTSVDEAVRIAGNRIGTDIDGVDAVPNGTGVLLEDANGVLIGGTEPDARNVISGNTGNGVMVAGDLSTGNTIRGNSIYANGGLGIDLGGDGVTRNDLRDLDAGPNDLQNMPVIGLAVTGPTTRVAGVLHSTPTASFTLDFYAVSELDPTGHGEGQRWLGSGIVATDTDGNGSYDLVLDAATEAGEWITATATNTGGSTSEFSKRRVDGAPANTLVVTNTKDSGIGSLRQAITAANQIGGSDSAHIWFRIPTTDTGYTDTDSHLPDGDSLQDVFVITPHSPLPAVTRGNVSIDGNTQYFLGGNSNLFGPEIVLNGSALAATSNGLQLDSDGNRVLGFVIQEFSGNGILVTGDENEIYGSYIGTTATGTEAAGNRGSGIYLEDASSNQIGAAGYVRTQTRDFEACNVISGNAGYGIAVQRGARNQIEGNLIGTDAIGAQDRGNANSGVLLQDTTENVLRGNVISGNDVHGVFVVGSTPSTDMTNLIEANLIGTDAIGTHDLGNTLMGIRIQQGVGSVVRGNVVSGNDNSNVLVDANGSGVLIEGNFVGTDKTGNTTLLNPQGQPAVGVTLVGRGNMLRGNVISANPLDGVNIDALDVPDGRATGNVLQANLIGVGLDGVTPLGNGRDGIRIRRGASDNVIGAIGSDPLLDTDGNVIAHNTKQGVWVLDAASTGNTVRGNSIHSNGGLGIDLGPAGATLNDGLDADTGPNDLQNFPAITTARRTAEQLLIRGEVDSRPSTTLLVDVYASTLADPSGYGEGQRWLGAVQVTTNIGGSGRFEIAVDPALASVGEWVTVTATDVNRHNTSEFSQAASVQGEGVPIGGLVLNEVMANPGSVPDAAGEWFELFNPTEQGIQLQGLVIEDASGTQHVISDKLIVPAGGYRVLGSNGDSGTNGGVRLDYGYQDIALGNTGGSLRLVDPSGIEIDRVSWQTTTAGVALALREPSLDNALPENWCLAGTAYGAGDLGTPGTVNVCIPEVPELVIHEIMQNPAAVDDSVGEWFEVYNPMDVAADLNGLIIQDDAGQHTIDNGGPLLVRAGQYLVLGNNGDLTVNGGLAIDYQYAGISLGNGSDWLTLLDRSGTQVIDQVAWDDGATFPDPNGASMALIAPDLDNDSGSNWRASRTPFVTGDLGTPGDANDTATATAANASTSEYSGTLVVLRRPTSEKPFRESTDGALLAFAATPDSLSTLSDLDDTRSARESATMAALAEASGHSAVETAAADSVHISGQETAWDLDAVAIESNRDEYNPDAFFADLDDRLLDDLLLDDQWKVSRQ